jgi:hypothetical protein
MKNNSSLGAKSRRRIDNTRTFLSIPQHIGSIRITKKIRFTVVTTQLFENSFTQTQLLDLLAVVTTANTTAYRLCSAMRIRKVEIWAVPPNVATGAQVGTAVAIEYNSNTVAGLGSPSVRVSDATQNPSVYAHVVAKPDEFSLAGAWFNDGASSPVLTLTAPVGGIVDITLDLVFRDKETPVATRAITSGALGAMGIVPFLYPTSGMLYPSEYQAIV